MNVKAQGKSYILETTGEDPFLSILLTVKTASCWGEPPKMCTTNKSCLSLARGGGSVRLKKQLCLSGLVSWPVRKKLCSLSGFC